MPRKSTGDYPENWDEIATEIKELAGWRCVRCGHEHDGKEIYFPAEVIHNSIIALDIQP